MCVMFDPQPNYGDRNLAQEICHICASLFIQKYPWYLGSKTNWRIEIVTYWYPVWRGETLYGYWILTHAIWDNLTLLFTFKQECLFPNLTLE